MRTCPTLLAIFAFALHLLLGCCWHHAHGASELAGHHHDSHGCSHVHLPTWFWSSAPAPCEHHHHGHHDHDDSDDTDTTPHAPCSDPQCVFLVSGQLTAPADSDLHMPIASVDCLLVQHDSTAEVVDLAPREKAHPHLRRHLALSRFLN